MAKKKETKKVELTISNLIFLLLQVFLQCRCKCVAVALHKCLQQYCKRYAVVLQ